MVIRIKSDYGEVYECGQEMTLEALKQAYEEANWMDDGDPIALNWSGWTEKEVLKFITDAWGIDYDIVTL
jgi:hypothetical protein